jgi:hypothetical protein
MKHTLTLFAALLTLLPGGVLAQSVSPAPRLINFQGSLARPDGTPVLDGNYSIKFSLFDAATGGSQKWTETINPVAVKNGVYSVLLGRMVALTDAVFAGGLWLEIKVDSDPPLTPRQQLVSVPYAMKANSVPDASITGAKIAPGAITAAKLAAGVLNFWSLTGNSGTNPSANFVGTTDNQPLVFKVNSRRAMRYAYVENASVSSINVLGGADINQLGSNIIGGTIAGGGRDYFTGTDAPNRVTADFGTVGGGAGNIASGPQATVAGGEGNTAGSAWSAVSGGFQNTASGEFAVVSGGQSNTASGLWAAVPGGYKNVAAGGNSFAAGRNAKANHANTFVWNTNLGDFASTGDNQFLIWADAGVGIGTNSPHALLDVNGNAHFGDRVGIGTTSPLTALHVVGSLHLEGTSQDISVNNGNNLNIGHYDGTTFTENLRIDGAGHVGINDTSPTYRLELPNIATDGEGRARANRWDTYSSGRWKHNITPIENALEKVLNLRGVMFDWNPEHGGTHDIGFVAEEAGKVVPELVSWEPDGKSALGMAYDRVTALLVEAVKQQQGQIVTQQKQIGELKRHAESADALLAENAELKRRLDALTTAVERLTASRQ